MWKYPDRAVAVASPGLSLCGYSEEVVAIAVLGKETNL